MDTMLSKALREFMTGPLNQLIVNLGGNDGVGWEEQLKHFLRKEPCWVAGQAMQVAKTTHLILSLIGTTKVSATTSPFVAKTKFVRNTNADAKVKISDIGSNFTAWFLSGDGKIEAPLPEQTLRYHKLLEASLDDPIIEELGGKVKAETTLQEMYSQMEMQGNGQAGVLLNNGYWNIFYIMDQKGVLRAVFVGWYGGGWFVLAGPVEFSFRWGGGRHVFSRNVLVPSVA